MASSLLDGTPFAGMEHKFNLIIVQDEDSNITMTKGPRDPPIPGRITYADGLEPEETVSGKRLIVREDVKKGGLICLQQATSQYRRCSAQLHIVHHTVANFPLR